jgi:hypothetical protein
MSRSFDGRWADAVAEELAAQPVVARPPLAEAELGALPGPVRRYVLASGAVGRPVPQNFRVTFDATMFRAPGGPPMRATTAQLDWLGRPARLFLMKARMFGLPVRALHLYRKEQATFQVRVAGVVTIVDLAGDELTVGETVTVLNDLCAFGPGFLADPRLAWQVIDDRSAHVTFTNGSRRATATLLFNERDELVDFWSDDRPESDGGRLVPRRWSTPLSGYEDVGGLRLATHGDAVYQRPDGPFTYGSFSLRSLAYDVASA